MKSLKFISSTNGLQVSGPADAFPSPNCDAVMCPGEIDVAPAFVCTPQLNPGGEGPLMFTFTAADVGEGVAGGAYSDTGGWLGGTGPALVDIESIMVTQLGIAYDDGNAYSSVTMTIYDSDGGTVVESLALINMEGTLWIQEFMEPIPLTIGESYCVEFTLVPVEP